jgi:hypothetical protein
MKRLFSVRIWFTVLAIVGFISASVAEPENQFLRGHLEEVDTDLQLQSFYAVLTVYVALVLRTICAYKSSYDNF